jgi:hypothetical protein
MHGNGDYFVVNRYITIYVTFLEITIYCWVQYWIILGDFQTYIGRGNIAESDIDFAVVYESNRIRTVYKL